MVVDRAATVGGGAGNIQHRCHTETQTAIYVTPNTWGDRVATQPRKLYHYRQLRGYQLLQQTIIKISFEWYN